jgi:S1-C subfamily serine protease
MVTSPKQHGPVKERLPGRRWWNAYKTICLAKFAAWLFLMGCCATWIYYRDMPQVVGTLNERAAVHRIAVGNSLGSGVAVASRNGQTLILTAWHVVQDGGDCTVSDIPAKVIGMDDTWDVAAIVVDETLPIAHLSNRQPVVGDNMTVCGFGSGDYLEATGEVVKFYSPMKDPATDFVAITAAARSGDSGGPLFYDDGTVGAILFGSDSVGAHGAHCVRVRKFLATLQNYESLVKAIDIDYSIW